MVQPEITESSVTDVTKEGKISTNNKNTEMSLPEPLIFLNMLIIHIVTHKVPKKVKKLLQERYAGGACDRGSRRPGPVWASSPTRCFRAGSSRSGK